MSRIYLSPPHLGQTEHRYIGDAIASNWVAPLGPHVDAFEVEMAKRVEVAGAAALSSGTAALHLAARLVGVGPGDDVIVPSFTFIASAAAVTYQGARPVLVDSDSASWNLDPALVAEALEHAATSNRPVSAVIAVDLYGQPADYDALEPICAQYGVPLIEDSAEALGADYYGRPVGSFGDCAVFSFNGNKVITTSGGGMLVSSDLDLVEQARFLATQAREPAPHYEHETIGYNYRMSNILAAIGRGQLEVLDDRVAARRRNFAAYQERLGALAGVDFMPEAPGCRSSRWLTTLTIDPAGFGATREDVRLALEKEDIEARPVWKPMHLQRAFADSPVIGGGVAAGLFERGLCLPSGSTLTESDLDRICEVVRVCAG